MRSTVEKTVALVFTTQRNTCWVAILACLTLMVSPATAADWPQFRGPDRDGKSTQTGLLKQWPAAGPKLLWFEEDLGFGYASVVATADMLYTTGMEDQTGYVYAYRLDGNRVWKRAYGPGWTGGRPGTRTTPTYDDGRLYVMSGFGRVVCLDAGHGQEQWAVDTSKIFSASTLNWGITESLLVDGDHLICTPGGPNASLVALDKKTGRTVWVCRELGEQSAYCSPILIERGKQRLIVTLTAKSLVGLDAATGKLVWHHAHDARYDIHAVSPVYENGRIYITSGYGGARGEMLELSLDGKTVTKKWSDEKLDCHHGGVISLKGHVYGTSDQNSGGNLICLNLTTGQVAAEIRGVGKGSILYADGMIYAYGENGQLGLIKPSPIELQLISFFTIDKGNKEHWAHPTVAHGRLYVRHGRVLMAYDIKAAL